jgi:hypothetical protein
MSYPRASLPFIALATLALAGCSSSSSGGSGVPIENDCDATCKTLFSLDLGGSDWSSVSQIGSDAAGNVILVGKVSGAPNALGIDASQGPVWFLSKLDPAGHLVWKKELPSAALGPLLAVGAEGDIFLAGRTDQGAVLDLGGGPLVPATAGDDVMYVGELDPDGNHRWSRVVADLPPDPTGDGNQYVDPVAFAVDASGSMVIAGGFMGPLDLGSGELGYPQNPLASNAFVVKLDATGHHLWSQRFGSQPDGNTSVLDTSLFLHGVTIDGEGSIVLAGELFGALHVGGEVVTSAGFGDAFIGKLDASGNYVFAKAFGGVDNDDALGVSIAPDGAILFTGFTTGAADFGSGPIGGAGQDTTPFVAALEPDGALRSSTRVTSPGGMGGYGQHIVADAQGDVIAAFGDGQGTAISVLKLDPTLGETLHATTYALSDPTDLEVMLRLDAFALDPIGNALLGGELRGVVAFGQEPLSFVDMTAWGQSAIVAKVAP